MSYAGQPLKRLEDPRLLTGHGSFVDDLYLPGMLYARVLRSPHAHAHLRAIDIEAARRLPGVVAVLTGADIAGALGDLPTRAMEGEWQGGRMHRPEETGVGGGKGWFV